MSNEEPVPSKLTRAEIDRRIEYIQQKLSRATHTEDLRSLNRTLERLIMLEACDD
jgi:hypothetical protein